MVNKNLRVIGMVFLLGVGILLLFSSFTDAVLLQPHWEKGDYWDYRTTTYFPNLEISPQNSTGREEVVGEENITVDGMDYNAIVVGVGEKGNYSGRFYYRSSDLALIKFEYVTINFSDIFQPPWNRWSYPIQVGEIWEQEGNVTRCIFNRTEKHHYIFHSICTGKTEISVPAGTFSCYIIKEYDEEEDNYGIYYISSEVGREVKTELYENGELSSEKVLLSFFYQGKTNNGKSDEGIPGFEILSLMGSISIVTFFIRKSLKRCDDSRLEG